MEHPTDMCPTLQETESDYLESVGAMSGYQYGKQPYQIWKATILAKVESRIICSSAIQNYPECTSRTNRLSITDSTISDTIVPVIETTKNASSRQFAISKGHDESARSSNLPSQTIPNPRGNASAITLRSGKALPQSTPQQLPRSVDADFESDANS
ncbi:hypothetical protein CR513_10984, partial [Mucuna pruriens]